MLLAESGSYNPARMHFYCHLNENWVFPCPYDSLAATTGVVEGAWGKGSAGLSSNPTSAFGRLCDLRALSTLWMVATHPFSGRPNLGTEKGKEEGKNKLVIIIST